MMQRYAARVGDPEERAGELHDGLSEHQAGVLSDGRTTNQTC